MTPLFHRAPRVAEHGLTNSPPPFYKLRIIRRGKYGANYACMLKDLQAFLF